MIFLKSLSVVLIFVLAALCHAFANKYIGDMMLPLWVQFIPTSLINAAVVLYYPRLLRHLADLFSIDITYWEENRDELTVVRVAVFVFFLMWLLYVVGDFMLGGMQFLNAIPEWARTFAFGGCVYACWWLGDSLAVDVANIFNIPYPNVQRMWEEAQSESDVEQTDEKSQ